MDETVCGRPAVPHDRQESARALCRVRRHRGGRRHHRSPDEQESRLRICEYIARRVCILFSYPEYGAINAGTYGNGTLCVCVRVRRSSWAIVRAPSVPARTRIRSSTVAKRTSIWPYWAQNRAAQSHLQVSGCNQTIVYSTLRTVQNPNQRATHPKELTFIR